MPAQPPRESQTTGVRWKDALYEIIFEADTPAGRAFDIVLLWVISLSVLTVMLESVDSIAREYRGVLVLAEWIFTILFTVEYVLRLVIVRRPLRYARSFFGMVDLVACLPTYLSLVLAGSQYLVVIRILRMLRVFRILKMGRHLREGDVILAALKASLPKITVFLFGILALTIVMGTLMYLIEGAEAGFTSIPASVYWAIVTITTVGYGDIAPATVPGQFLASVMMIMGYAIIAVPTGIVTVELAQASRRPVSTQACPSCGVGGHDSDARFCKHCGAGL
jgi:voltage-gated potassium channel